MQIEIRTDVKTWARGMDAWRKKQIPFALSLALTSTAGRVGQAWQAEMRQDLDRPTPFTLNSVRVIGARKTRLISTIFVMDKAGAYLEPFVVGGRHFLGAKKGLLNPKNVPLNAYGNLTKGKLKSLKAKAGVFVGPVKLRSGQVVNGVWQRRGGKGQPSGPRGLQLLIRFTDPQEVKQRLRFAEVAEKTVRAHFEAEFAKALKHALATATPS